MYALRLHYNKKNKIVRKLLTASSNVIFRGKKSVYALRHFLPLRNLQHVKPILQIEGNVYRL